MTRVRLLAGFVIIVMIGMTLNIAVNDSLDHGVGLDVFLAGVASPWQAFINQDLVSGLLLTVGWIIYRQRGSPVPDTIIWVWLALWWGNIVVASYILVAAAQSNGDWPRFFMGTAITPAGRRRTATPGVLRIAYLAAAALTAAYLIRSVAHVVAHPIAVIGYVAGFTPIVLAFLRLAAPRPASRVVHS